MIRAGLVVIVVVSVALLMMVMTADWLNAWPFPIGRSRDWWYLSGFLGGLLTGWVASLVTVALYRRGLFGPTFPVSGPEDLAAMLVGRILSDVHGENGLILIFGDRRVIITSADPYQPLEVVVQSSQAADDWEAGLWCADPSHMETEGIVLRGCGRQTGGRTMGRHGGEGCAMGCPGHIEGCTAEAFLCPCGILACELHGHVDVGDDPYCPHWLRAESMTETDGRGYEDIDLSSWEEGRA